jgi:hypothetical protein
LQRVPEAKKSLQKNTIVSDKPIYESKLDFEGGISRQMLSGVKRITLRRGKRYFNKNVNIHGYNGVIESVKHTTLLHLDFTTLSQQGFKSMFNTLLILQRFYPKIDINTPISVVEYRILPY